MADYTRAPARFFYRGISLLPEDALPDGKIGYALNVRSYQEGSLTTRWGVTKQTTSALPAAVHSLFRLNDTSAFALSGAPERRFAGAGTILYVGDTTPSAYASVYTGFSGDPLTAVVASPVNSPRPFIYIADSAVMRKINSSLNDMPFGIDTPSLPPTGVLGEIQTTYLESVGGGGWGDYGIATGTAIVNRSNTVVTQILYDSGSTGMASVALADMASVVPGQTLEVGASPETVIVQEVIPPVSSTTIGRILYDNGTSGLCTIQPEGSFTAGQTEAAIPDELRRRYEDLNLPVPARVTVSRTVDFPVHGLVTLGGSETVQILSVALGSDGTMSFRCLTSGTFVATDAIDGIACLRASFVSTRNVGDPVGGEAVENTLTPPSATAAAVGGMQTPIVGLNWGLAGTQATQPDDIIRIGIKVSAFAYLQSVRLMLDVADAGVGTEFLENYYVYEWRANDLLTAVQASLGAATGLMADALTAAVTQGQMDALYDPQYGQEPFRRPSGDAPPGSDEDTRKSPGRRNTRRLQTDGFVTAGATPSRQLSLGDNQWVMLQCRVRDLTRVGTDMTKTLSGIDAAAVVFQALGTTDPITCAVADGYLTGGYGPDVASTLPPYVYRYRGRSTITGERGNPSPPMRAGLLPHRGRVTVTPGEAITAAQCDVLDWFRYGGALSRWQYVGTQPNSVTAFNDDMADTDISGGETLRTDLFQPWPSSDLPRSGTATLAGTSVERVSGDTFDTDWAADSIIIINGRATTLYQSPTSSSRLEVVDNCGEGAAVDWSMPSPTLLGQAFPVIWGGPINGVWFNFACGDPADPSLLHWTFGNDPDATSPDLTLVATSASEPLQNGFFFDGNPYVFTTDNLLRIVPTFGDITTFRCVKTPCTKGLWSRWFMAVAPEGVYFGSKDGIYLTAAGGPAVSITAADLGVLFPQDGSGPDGSVRGLYPIDFTVTARLKLTYVDSTLYFDYQDTQGSLRTLVYEPLYKRWTPDVYAASGVTARLGETGPQVHTNLLGCANGNLYQVDDLVFTDDGTTITWAAWTPWANGNDARQLKQWGDAVVDAIGGEGFTVTPVSANGATSSPTTAVAAGSTRTTTVIEVEAGDGVLARNFGLKIDGTLAAGADTRPVLFLWEPSFLFKQVSVARRATDWENLGYVGAKFIQGVVIRANTFNAEKTVEVQYEGGHVGVSLNLIHDGEVQYAYPIESDGWTPFVAELVRIVGTDALPWTLLDWRWVWEPAPEAATQWQTQETTFDLPGYMEVRDCLIAYQAACPVTLTVWHGDDDVQAHVLPTTDSLYSRYYQPLESAKGRWVRFRLTADSPFRVFKSDCSVRVQGWGQPGGYLVTRPFGGPHRADGAAI